MGIDYSAKIIVGLPSYELSEVDEDIVDDLDVAPPFYDADSSIIGICVANSGCYSDSELDVSSLPNAVEEAKQEFKKLTGLDAKVFITTCGW